jgi:hypothetical protein
VTIAIAQRRGDDILLVADTKITDKSGMRRGIDELPGRLKVVTFAERMTAAFAGNEGLASYAIRDARRACRQDGPAAALDVLVDSSGAGEVEYLVAAHHDEAMLVRIKDGGRLYIQDDVCAIGVHEPFKEMIDRARADTREPLSKGVLRTKFVDVIMTGKHGEASVGGFPIAVWATAAGHRYVGHDGGYTYEFPPLWGRTTVQSMEQVYTGQGHFRLAIMASESMDVPIVGACLVQARRGYVYSPIESPQCPEPYTIDLLPGEEKWEGREREMYAALRAAIAKHVEVVASL